VGYYPPDFEAYNTETGYNSFGHSNKCHSNTWYHIEIDADFTAHTYQMYVNGALLGTHAIPSAQTSAGYVLIEKIGGGNVYIDNIEVGGASSVAIFAQVADGGGYSTTFSLLNNQSTAINGQLKFYNTDGTPRSLTINGVTGTQFSVNLPVDGSLYMTTSNAGPTTSGWAILNSDLPVQSVATFDYRNDKGTLTTTAAVLGSGAATKVALPVETNSSLDTGVAIVNFGSSTISVRLRLLNETGSEIANKLNLLDAQKQLVGFVSQFFSTVQGIGNFKGVLTAEVEGQGSFAATSLILKEGMYSALPVVVIK
jgi:hypothetical protein